MKFPVIVKTGTGGFSENQAKYKCCCNHIHVKVAAIIIGVIEAIQCFGGVAGLSSKMSFVSEISTDTGDNIKAVYGAGLAFEVIECIVVVVFFVGIFMENHLFLVPHLIMQTIGLIILLGIMIIFIYMAAAGPGNMFADAMTAGMENLNIHKLSPAELKLDGKEYLYAVCIPMIIFFLASVAFDLWWIVEVMKCYRYFKEKKQYALRAPSAPSARASYQAGGSGYY